MDEEQWTQERIADYIDLRLRNYPLEQHKTLRYEIGEGMRTVWLTVEILEKRNAALQKQVNALGFDAVRVDDEEPEYMNYKEWLEEQWWPEESDCATIDKEGGCCWWHGEPAMASDTDLGWEGNLVERYYDTPAPFDATQWKNSLLQRDDLEQGN